MTSSLIQSFDREKLSFQTRQGLLAHIDACLDNCSHYLTSDESLIIYGGFLEGFQTTFATFYGEHDRYKDAEKLFLKSLSLQQQKLGYENIATLSTLNNLGALYLEARQLERAKANLELALQVKETMLGPDHPRTLNSVNNMGNLLTLQTNYDGARQMYQRTLEGYSKINGAMHKTVFESLNNLGEVAMKKGDFPEAEQIFKKAFTMARTLSGDKDDSLVLYLASNVALVYKLQHKYQEALQIYSDVVTGRERLVGAEHSSTLQSMCEVADVYTILGDEASANEWYHKGNASPERRERGKLGATMETEPKLTISRANDNPTENLTPSAPAAGQSSSLPLHRDSQNDDVTQLIHEDDQMEWESLPQSKPAMTSSPSIVSQDFVSDDFHLDQIDRGGISASQEL
jgi:tetratricopeptide (TPR) repeat protein